jgi:hypothetical protein
MAGPANATAKKSRPTQKAPQNVAAGTKTYKFATLTAEAKAKMDERTRNNPVMPPFVIDDVDPPIVITAPDNLERILVAAEGFSAVERGDMGAVMPVMRAICGDAFPRVWWLVREDKGVDRAMALLNALAKHFEEVLAPYQEAAELPGGSSGSSD